MAKDASCRFVRFARNRESGTLNRLSSLPLEIPASFASDSAGPNSTARGHSAAFSLNTALHLHAISKHCLVCGQTHNKWWPAMSDFPGSMVIKLACDAEHIERRKASLASSAHVFWGRPELISLATFYSLQQIEENRTEAPCTVINTPLTAGNNPGCLGYNVLSNVVAIYLPKCFFFLSKLCYSYQLFEQSSSQLPWSPGLNFFCFLPL